MRTSKSAHRVPCLLGRLLIQQLKCWAVLGLFLGAIGQAQCGFFAALAFAAGNTPNSVTVADFNGDGIPDLAVTNLFGSTVRVLLGNGDGTFRPGGSFRVRTYPV